MVDVVIDGPKIKSLRDSREMSQGALARASGVAQSYISRLEGHRTSDIQLSTINRLARALDVSPMELLLEPGREPGGDEGLPDFHMYLGRRFANEPGVRRALVATYEAIRSVEEELDQRVRRREAEPRGG
ncbi:MAG: helix-turn-helix transcriptional regulator [Chloroflexi bacterium]|nr:helix-turn-helix transcriptional regulator [Chloroflexota bacterium]MCL5109428.1 helix-turn-helix transcriptional regulator [Chloroflexota bacterium]